MQVILFTSALHEAVARGPTFVSGVLRDWSHAPAAAIAQFLNGKDANGYTALHLAVMSNTIETVGVLMQTFNTAQLCVPANPNILDSGASEQTPLTSAIELGHTDIALKLICHSACDVNTKVNAITIDTRKLVSVCGTALHFAVAKGNPIIVNALLSLNTSGQRQCDINAVNVHNETPLALAIKLRDVPMVRLLLMTGREDNMLDLLARYPIATSNCPPLGHSLDSLSASSFFGSPVTVVCSSFLSPHSPKTNRIEASFSLPPLITSQCASNGLPSFPSWNQSVNSCPKANTESDLQADSIDSSVCNNTLRRSVDSLRNRVLSSRVQKASLAPPEEGGLSAFGVGLKWAKHHALTFKAALRALGYATCSHSKLNQYRNEASQSMATMVLKSESALAAKDEMFYIFQLLLMAVICDGSPERAQFPLNEADLASEFVDYKPARIEGYKDLNDLPGCLCIGCSILAKLNTTP